MEPLKRAQVLLQCDLCQSDSLQSHCEFCQVNLCKACVGEHLSDSSQRHNVVPYKYRSSAPYYPKCPDHTNTHCEFYCEICDVPVCSTCISSDKHKGHTFTDVLKKVRSKKKELEKDLEELEKRIYPAYEEITLDLNSEKVNFENHYKNLTTAVTKQEKNLHREISIIVNKQKSEIDEMKNKHSVAENEHEKEIKQITSDVKQSINDLKKILYSNDVSLTSVYRSRNAEFRGLPPKVNVSLPRFTPHQINTEQLHQMFGSLSAITITKEAHSNTIKTPEAVSCPPAKSLLDAAEFITSIQTKYNYLYNVTCLSDEEIWTHGEENIMKLYNLRGEVLRSIITKSGNNPRDTAVTRSGDLVYIDIYTSTVNIVKNEQIQEVIRLQGWKPHNICGTTTGDLLVTMDSANGEHSRVVRYSGSTEKQTIQFDSEGKSLYSYGYTKDIIENRNLDICVADCNAKAVVVVNQAGKFRFRYTGYSSSTARPLDLIGITTDSQSQILISDRKNNSIHILDQHGQLLSYIRNCDLHLPWGLSVDTKDNLFVAEFHSHKVKKIKYM
ncbi:E3 ubiquitin-protein ligase TRIM71-like [Saccostrea echinata]|uniref:E3 ubiquitin-protein ligase TRIM71-like n=1 Tax=Saccostrea echinata TaxID=191078 RepID=UPI002A7FE39B|nr:E3 ubiquitin-protein ligase TRIM71-like [Saccostrea echinata]